MAQLDQELGVADVYAAALFELARESGQVAETRAELDELLSLVQTQPEFANFMESRGLGVERREAGLERMFRGRLSDATLNTLLVMNRHERAGLIAAMHRRFVLRQEQASNEIEAVATSAVELPGEQRAEIERLASELSGKRALVQYRVRPEILGGLILQVGDVRWDNSLRTRLEAARSALRERAERGFEEVSSG